MYPSSWDINETDGGELSPIARMLQKALKSYYVHLRPLDALVPDTTGENIWTGPNTKLLGYNLTEFDRIVTLDAGSVVKYNLDELFLIPATPLAMPYIYWGQPEDWQFSTQLMIMTPSKASFSRITDTIKGNEMAEHDTSILEKLFHGKIIKIPQRPFALLPGEYRRKSHDNYLEKRWPKRWNADEIHREARIVYFSDYPIPKPWIKANQELINRHMPRCDESKGFGASNCRDRQVWLKLYSDYGEKRKALCGKEFEPVFRQGPVADTKKGTGRIFHTT